MVKAKLKPPAKAFQFAAEVQIGKESTELSGGLDDVAKAEGTELADGEPEKSELDGGTEEEPPPSKPKEEPTALAAGNVPVQIVARTGGVADQLFWGRCVHDFAGMSAPAVIPLDYMHDPCEIVGIGDRIDASNGVLNIGGQLIPFHDKDRASEIILRSKNKTPYQASILMGWNDYVSEDLPAGETTEVNGQTITGPVVIFRKWSLRGVAICPYGADAGTSIGLDGEPPREEMSDETPVDPPKEELAEETEETAAAEAKPVEEETGKFATGPGAKFLAEFGDAGGVLFAKGLTIEQARVEFAASLKRQNAQLQADLAAAKGQLSAGTAPVTFQAATAATEAPAAQSLTPGLAKFAAGIKFRR